MMRPLPLIALLYSLAAPVAAEDDNPERLMERGTQMFLEGLLQRMQPTINDLQGLAAELGPQLDAFLTEMGPALQGLLEQVEDWSAYHPPEVLENGDIIIRRKEPKTPPLAEGEIEL